MPKAKKEISADIVRRVAKTARLGLSDSEIKALRKDLSEMLKAFSDIDRLDTGKVKASFHPMDIKDVLREDRQKECLPHEKALENTAHKENGFFKGPRVV